MWRSFISVESHPWASLRPVIQEQRGGSGAQVRARVQFPVHIHKVQFSIRPGSPSGHVRRVRMQEDTPGAARVESHAEEQ